MHLYVIRHADAVPLGERGINTDEERPLTDAGHAQSRAVALALRKLGVKIDRVLTSPLARARETAEGVVAHWGDGAPRILECEPLAPGGKKRDLLAKLREQGVDSLAVVGHNPEISELVCWLIGDKQAGISMEKAGVALVEFERVPGKGSGHLAWLVTPVWSERLISP